MDTSLHHLPFDILFHDICSRLNVYNITQLCQVNKTLHHTLDTKLMSMFKIRLQLTDAELKTITRKQGFELSYNTSKKLTKLRNNNNKCVNLTPTDKGKTSLCLQPTIYKSPMSAYCKCHSNKKFPYEKLFTTSPNSPHAPPYPTIINTYTFQTLPQPPIKTRYLQNLGFSTSTTPTPTSSIDRYILCNSTMYRLENDILKSVVSYIECAGLYFLKR